MHSASRTLSANYRIHLVICEIIYVNTLFVSCEFMQAVYA